MEALPKIYKNFDLVCVISQRMAGQIWPGEDPIGKRFQLGFPEMHLPAARVIGIVGSTTQIGLDRGELPEFYCLLKQYPAPMGLHLVVRTRADPAGVLASVRTAIRSVAPDEPIYSVELMTSRIAGFSSDRRFNMGLFIFFAATALLLAVVGIYGVLACVVSQRTREVGIRMALGAQRRDVLRDVLARGLRLALPGVVLGLAGAWAVSRLLQSQLFGSHGHRPAHLRRQRAAAAARRAGCLLRARPPRNQRQPDGGAAGGVSGHFRLLILDFRFQTRPPPYALGPPRHRSPAASPSFTNRPVHASPPTQSQSTIGNRESQSMSRTSASPSAS